MEILRFYPEVINCCTPGHQALQVLIGSRRQATATTEAAAEVVPGRGNAKSHDSTSRPTSAGMENLSYKCIPT